MQPGGVVLVTGYPSLLARRMVEEILTREPLTEVRLVVLPKLLPGARAAIDRMPEGVGKRVEVIDGDAAAMDLGLSGAEFRRITGEIDQIHHCAQVSYPGVDKKAAEANVLGAAEILEVARASRRLACLVHHSTALVAGDRAGVVAEADLELGQSFRNAVEETRMRAEQLMRRAMAEVPIAVVRPTAIVGDSSTGEIDRLEGLYLLVLLVLAAPQDVAIPFPGKGEAPLHVVPIDFVARAAHAIGRARGASGKTYHLADPSPLSARAVFDLVAKAGGRRAGRSHIPANVAKALLKAPGIERFVRSPRHFVEQLTSAVRYDTSNADAILGPLGVACPPFASYVEPLVAVVQEHVRTRDQARADAEVEDPLL